MVQEALQEEDNNRSPLQRAEVVRISVKDIQKCPKVHLPFSQVIYSELYSRGIQRYRDCVQLAPGFRGSNLQMA